MQPSSGVRQARTGPKRCSPHLERGVSGGQRDLTRVPWCVDARPHTPGARSPATPGREGVHRSAQIVSSRKTYLFRRARVRPPPTMVVLLGSYTRPPIMLFQKGTDSVGEMPSRCSFRRVDMDERRMKMYIMMVDDAHPTLSPPPDRVPACRKRTPGFIVRAETSIGSDDRDRIAR